MPDMFLVRYIGGQSYRGYDPGANRHVDVEAGELITVSAEKLKQLLTDFPNDWDDYGTTQQASAETVAENVVDTQLEVPQPSRRPSRRKPRNPQQEK